MAAQATPRAGMMSPVTSSVRTIDGSAGTLYRGWKSSCRLSAGGRPVRKANEGWSRPSIAGPITRAVDTWVMLTTGGEPVEQAAASRPAARIEAANFMYRQEG